MKTMKKIIGVIVILILLALVCFLFIFTKTENKIVAEVNGYELSDTVKFSDTTLYLVRDKSQNKIVSYAKLKFLNRYYKAQIVRVGKNDRIVVTGGNNNYGIYVHDNKMTTVFTDKNQGNNFLILKRLLFWVCFFSLIVGCSAAYRWRKNKKGY